MTDKGVTRDVRLPHRKALVAGDTGEVIGIVGAGYKVFTNHQAVSLCHQFCLKAFPDTKAAEWQFVDGHGPATRSWVAMNIHHQSHAINLMGNGGPSEIYTPFVRITAPIFFLACHPFCLPLLPCGHSENPIILAHAEC